MKVKLSENHKILLDIVFGKDDPSRLRSTKKIPIDCVDEAALRLMADLIKIEFNASLQKELKNNDEESVANVEAYPYDVYVVEPTFRNNNINIAVAVPVKGDGFDDKLVLEWYDENDNIWAIDELTATRKVASLSGTVRVLDNLAPIQMTKLMTEAMKRINLFDVSILTPADGGVVSVDTLNQSQSMAVLAAESKPFSSGFFVVQGT